MYCLKTFVRDRKGLHAVLATMIATTARNHCAKIYITNLDNRRRANARSVLEILSLETAGGTPVQIVADGAEAEAAVCEIKKLVCSDAYSRA